MAVTGTEVDLNVGFQLLGPFQVTSAGQVVEIGSPKQRALLAMLVLNRNQPVSQDRLAEELWSGRPPASLSTTLPSLVSRLRRTLTEAGGAAAGLALRTVEGGYVLDVAPSRLDSHGFEQGVEQGRAALAAGDAALAAEQLRLTLALWRGPALGDLAERPFAMVEAARLDEARLEAVESLVDAELAAGRPAAALALVEGHVAAHPLREQAWGRLMVALYRLGRQAEALRAYHDVRRLLADELGLEPTPALRRLEQQVLDHSPELAGPEALGRARPVASPSPRHNLPTPLTPFVGRAAELAELERALPGTRLLTLTGLGGSGKTRLALELASRAQGRFADGAWLVELSALRDPALVTSAALAAVGIQAGGLGVGSSAPEDRLCQYLEPRHALLVLDNCEHLVEAVARLVHTVLARCPGIVVLATSRETLGLPGELAWLVPGLGLPPAGAVTAEDLEGSDAVAFFCSRAATAQPGFGLSDANAAPVAQIARRLDGIPLAIELAAARTRVLGAYQVADGLDDRFRLLTGGARTAVPRHQTLRAAMDWSYDLLPGPEQDLLRNLCVFPQSFDLQAAEAVARPGPSRPGFEMLDLLARLVDKSLVIVEDQDGRARYRLLETVRQYGAEKLAEPGALDAAHRRHRDHYLEMTGPGRGATIEWFAGPWVLRAHPDHDNYLLALDWSLAAGDMDAALVLAAALTPYWFWGGRLGDHYERLERSLAGSKATIPARIQGAVGLGLALMDCGRGDSRRLDELIQEGHSLALDLGDAHAKAFTRYLVGCVPNISGDRNAQSRRDLSEALAMHEALGSVLGVAWCHYELSGTAMAHDPEEARAHIERGLEVERRAGPDGVLHPHLLAMLALTTALAGEPERSRALGAEAIGAARSVPLPGVLVMALARAAQAAAFSGRQADAREIVSEWIGRLRDYGAKRWVAESLETAALILEADGAHHAAARLLAAAGELRGELGELLTARSALAARVGECRARLVSALGPGVLSEEEALGRSTPTPKMLSDALDLLAAGHDSLGGRATGATSTPGPAPA